MHVCVFTLIFRRCLRKLTKSTRPNLIPRRRQSLQVACHFFWTELMWIELRQTIADCLSYNENAVFTLPDRSWILIERYLFESHTTCHPPYLGNARKMENIAYTQYFTKIFVWLANYNPLRWKRHGTSLCLF